jgi:hypothetical protein
MSQAPSRKPLACFFGAGLVALGACAPPVNPAGDPLKATKTGEAFDGVQCSAVRPQTEPDLMAWDPGSRANLNQLRHQGVVAVRYEAKGCNVELELLSHCIGTAAKYEFSPYSANEHKVAHNASELFAQLPVGAARLSGSLKGNRALRTDYMLAGQYVLPAGATFRSADLRGADCARATHVVSAVYVGAFAMGAGESRAMEGSATLLSAGANARSAADVEVLDDEGNAAACAAAQSEGKADDRCAVPLRIGLLALEGKSEAPAPAPSPGAPAHAAMANLAPIAVPAALPEGGIGLDADADVLVAYDAALKADGRGEDAPAPAIAAWKKVASLPGKNPYRDLATKRETAWTAFVEAKEAQTRRKASDDERLSKVLVLDSITPDQKERMLKEYAQIYGAEAAVPLLALLKDVSQRARIAVAIGLPAPQMCEPRNAQDCERQCQLGSAESCLLGGRSKTR